MPRPDRLPPADRFFARLDRFVAECPTCGELIHVLFDRLAPVRKRLNRRRLGLRGKAMTYNPVSSRLTCPECRVVYAVGLLLYPVPRGSPGRQPADQKPTPRQLLALRRYAQGFYLQRVIQGADEVNVAVTAPCSCAQPYGWDTGCPIHGLHREGEGIT